MLTARTVWNFEAIADSAQFTTICEGIRDLNITDTLTVGYTEGPVSDESSEFLLGLLLCRR